MTKDQVMTIRDSYMVEAVRPDGKKSTRGEYVRICLDGGIDLVTSKDLVVFDDDNEVVHAVCVNEDMRSQASYPVKIISAEYSVIQQIETIMSQKNFESFLNDGFLNLSDAKKKAMLKWTRAIRNQAQQPIDAEPYFNSNPTIIPMADSIIHRDDRVLENDEPEVINNSEVDKEDSNFVNPDVNETNMDKTDSEVVNPKDDGESEENITE